MHFRPHPGAAIVEVFVIELNLTLKRRSTTQIELCTDFQLDPDKKKAGHIVDTYIFIPKSLGLSSRTYPDYLFYRDLQTNSELLPLTQTLSELAAGGGGLLNRMEQCNEESKSAEDKAAETEFETTCRSFSRIFKTAVDMQMEQILQTRGREISPAPLEEYLVLSRQLLQEYRQLDAKLQDASTSESMRRTFRFCDEYLSLTVEDSSCRLAYTIKHRKIENSSELIEQLTALAQEELEYRRSNDYLSIPQSKGYNEELVFRRKTLRTYVESVFSLNTYNKPESRLARELLLSMAAALSMIFATAATFMAHVRFDNWSTTFFVILVISYMFKDRIKALAQSYLNSKGKRFFFDFRNVIHAQSTAQPLGIQRESFGFVPGKELPAQITRLRNRTVLESLDNDTCGENVILFRRRSRFYPARLVAAFPKSDVQGLRQVLRFDFMRFIQKMEKSKSRVHIPDGKDYRKERGRYTYHVNMIIKFMQRDETKFMRYRIVMSNDGILRIEDVEVDAG